MSMGRPTVSARLVRRVFRKDRTIARAVSAAFRPNWKRLREVKRRYDPHNVTIRGEPIEEEKAC
jgi:berberine-like enzyme